MGASPELRIFNGLLLGEHQAVFNSLKDQGFQPLDVSGYPAYGAERVASIWEKVSPGSVLPWIAPCGLTSADHDALFATLPGQGYYPFTVSGYELLSGPRFTSFWMKIPGLLPSFLAHHGMTGDEFQAKLDELEPMGFMPYDVCGYGETNGPIRFAALWQRLDPRDWVLRYGLTTAALDREMSLRYMEGFMLRALSGYEVFGTPFYAAIWSRGSATMRVGADLTTSDFSYSDYYYQRLGYRATRIRGRISRDDDHRYSALWIKPYLSDNEASFIKNVMKVFMTKYKVPGMQVARTDHGRLTYAAAFGFISPDSTIPVSTTSLFRIASISKPITAATVFRLVDSNRLALDDRVFGPGGLLGETYGTPPYDALLLEITVRHLLEHTSGWATSPDHMFDHLDLAQHQLIDWMLGRDANGQPNAPLAHRPGTIWEYSNFGYCLLGRVIEAATRLPYEDAVRGLVLQPCGITDMRIAGDTLADRRPNEVVYTETGTSHSPYAFRVSRMDANGGWLASATDLMRFLVHVDGFPYQRDILSPASIATMFTPTMAPQPDGQPSTYAKGWNIHPGEGNRWHRGDLAGTQTIIVSTTADQGWAVLANGRDGSRTEEMFEGLDRLMWDIGNFVTDWPVLNDFQN